MLALRNIINTLSTSTASKSGKISKASHIRVATLAEMQHSIFSNEEVNKLCLVTGIVGNSNATDSNLD